MERKTFRLKLSNLDDQGVFEGYAGIFAVEDLQNDIIEHGAFKRTIDHSGGSVPILWQHKSDEPIGVGLESREDTNGLYVRGQLNLDTQKGREAYSLLKQGAIKGLSIGYDPVKKEYKDGKRILKEIKLYEYSVVTFPAQPLATVIDVKDESGPQEGKPEGGRGWDETDSSWRYRLKDPDLFVDDSFRSKNITDGVTLVMGKLKDGDGSMVAQSVVFNKDKFPKKADAQAWLDEHNDLLKQKSLSFTETFNEMKRFYELNDRIFDAASSIQQTIFDVVYSNEDLNARLNLASIALDEYKETILNWVREYSDFYGLKSFDLKVGRMLSSSNLSQIKDVIKLLQALVEKAEPSEDSADDHSEDEKHGNDPADTKSDSETSLDDELQPLIYDMKSYITR